MNLLLQYTTARSRRGSVIVGVLFAFAVVVGGEVYRNNSLAGIAESPERVLWGIGMGLAAFAAAAIAALLLACAQGALDRKKPLPAPSALATWQATVIAGFVLFLCWLPCLLAYWPGLLTYDIPTQTDYIATGHWTTQQPPLHTLIWSFFLMLEGACGLHAITWYALAQMAFLAASFAAVLSYLAKRGVNVLLWAAAALFFAANPVVALFAITPVKDTVLAGALSLVSVGIAQLVADPVSFAKSRARCVALAAGLLACCLLRANMLVAVALCAIVAAAALKQARKAVAAVFCVPLALAVIVMGPVYSAFGITPGSSAIASVPFQQVANVVRNHEAELSEAELATIDEVLPVDKIAKRYNPRFADKVVRLFKGRSTGVAAMGDKLRDFAFEWVELVGRYPGDAADAFLSLNVPYWYPFAETPDPYSKRAYVETSPWESSEHYKVALEPAAPALHGLYESAADFSAFDNPLGKAVFSPSSALWVLVLAFFLLYCSGSRRNALLAVIPALFWLSFLIGPVSNMRYMFPLFCLYPLLLCASLQPALVFGEEAR